jgi:hypothetical protein
MKYFSILNEQLGKTDKKTTIFNTFFLEWIFQVAAFAARSIRECDPADGSG